MDEIRRTVLQDCQALVNGGIHGLMLENFGDVPFYAGRVPTETVAHMTALAVQIRQQTDLPLGINVLRNDAMTALAIAKAVGAVFVRVNVLQGAQVTDQGVIQGAAADVMRYRRQLDAQEIRVLADVQVKHAAPLVERPIGSEVDELVHRGLADGIIVSGSATGAATSIDDLKQAKAAAGAFPVFVGSGVTVDRIQTLAPYADGFIVGTSLKQNGQVDQPVDTQRVKELVKRVAVCYEAN